MAIVMGLDQHRAQITAEWLDTESGELGRARIAPAHRGEVRRFLARFAGQQLEVALEATTGWRFAVEELRAIGADVHLAEPAETAARRGTKKRAKTDRADARHLREFVMLARLPESWIPPDHILDLRARVRLRHTLCDQRGEWQQRIQAVLYHHGLAQRRDLLNVLAFPGVLKGALEVRERTINEEIKLAAAHAIARVIPDENCTPTTSSPASSTAASPKRWPRRSPTPDVRAGDAAGSVALGTAHRRHQAERRRGPSNPSDRQRRLRMDCLPERVEQRQRHIRSPLNARVGRRFEGQCEKVTKTRPGRHLPRHLAARNARAVRGCRKAGGEESAAAAAGGSVR
jgi:hypothetical protein